VSSSFSTHARTHAWRGPFVFSVPTSSSYLVLVDHPFFPTWWLLFFFCFLSSQVKERERGFAGAVCFHSLLANLGFNTLPLPLLLLFRSVGLIVVHLVVLLAYLLEALKRRTRGKEGESGKR
jgi:hypothetical protein